MANFTYEASGKFCMSSWVSYRVKKFYRTKYAERDIVFVRKSAIRGVLERVAIKRVEFVTGNSTGGQMFYLYVDTDNAYWREDMLVEQADAVALAQEHYLHMIHDAQEALKDNGNSCLP